VTFDVERGSSPSQPPVGDPPMVAVPLSTEAWCRALTETQEQYLERRLREERVARQVAWTRACLDLVMVPVSPVLPCEWIWWDCAA
jgi:hypothetical protein